MSAPAKQNISFIAKISPSTAVKPRSPSLLRGRQGDSTYNAYRDIICQCG